MLGWRPWSVFFLRSLNEDVQFLLEFSYVWVKVMKKVLHTRPSAFNYFADRPQELY